MAIKIIDGNSDELCKRIASYNNGKDVICSFSMGKDSIASYIQLKRYFENVHLVFYYMVPDLEFQKRSIEYYENKLNTKIHVIPSPHWYHYLHNLVFQKPERIYAIDDFIDSGELFIPTYDELFACVKDELKIPQDTYVATGVRRDDSITRRMTIKQNGAENAKRHQFFPVFDWSIAKLREEIVNSGIKLPIDYKVWGRTFDGLQYEFVQGVKENFPNDYEKIKFWFPLVEANELRFRDFV
jgi:3'-phosphoadenosine 5'-phosphosulfate sulfotransferase (PAPS reductase)/FAD synthetase